MSDEKVVHAPRPRYVVQVGEAVGMSMSGAYLTELSWENVEYHETLMLARIKSDALARGNEFVRVIDRGEFRA